MSELHIVPKPKHDIKLRRLLDEMVDVYTKYVTFTEPEHAFVCALWCAQTWFFRGESVHDLDTVGYLAFVSPESNCGKSQALNLTAALSYGRPQVQLLSTSATVFRQMDEDRVTLVLDELDGLAEDDNIINVLNGGYRKGAQVRRILGKDHNTLKKFNIFGPKAFAYIRDWKSLRAIKTTIESRCIRIFLRKRSPAEQKASAKYRERIVRRETEAIVKGLADWELHRVPDLLPILDSGVLDVETFTGREEDVWENLLIVAYLAGCLDEAKEIAVRVVELNREEMVDHNEEDIYLLHDIYKDLGEMCDEWGFSTELGATWLQHLDDRPYGEMVKGRPRLTKQRLAATLAKYNLRTKPKGEGRVRRIDRAALVDVIERHVPWLGRDR